MKSTIDARLRAKLFVFEGPDGSGKSALSVAFSKFLNASGTACDRFAFPGDEEGTLGKHVHKLHHDLAFSNIKSIGATSLQLLHIAAHIDAIDNRIMPALERGRFVILDRFWWSTWVYGVVSGAHQKSLRAMIKLECSHWGQIKPDAVFLVKRKTPLGRSLSLDFQELARQYDKLATREARKYHVCRIQNDGTVEESLSEIVRNAKLGLEPIHA